MNKFLKRKKAVAAITAVFLFAAAAYTGIGTAESYGAEKTPEEPGQSYVSDEVLVVFEDDVNKREAGEVADDLGAEKSEIINTPQKEVTSVVTLPEGQTVEEAVDTYQDNPEVACVQPNYLYKLSESEKQPAAAVKNINDPEADEQWHIKAIGTEKAWDILGMVKHDKVKVAVLDTGADIDHVDLQANLNKNLSVNAVQASFPKLKGDLIEHGTHVAGIIGATANNSIGVTGVGSGAENQVVDLIAVNVFAYISDREIVDEPGNYAMTDDIIRGISYAGKQGAKVINMSLGIVDPNQEVQRDDPLFEQTVNAVTAQGVTVVCASGNYNDEVPNYPADFDASISVISTDQSGNRSSFSNYGTAKDLSAPGTSIQSTLPGSKYGSMNGTSMATPVVSGVAAMLYYLDPSLTVRQVKDILYKTATDIYTPGYDIQSGWGIVNAAKAVQAIVPSEPENLAVSKEKVLSWNPVQGASSYQIQIYKDNILQVTETTAAASFDLTAATPAAGKYQIRVSALSERNGAKLSSLPAEIDYYTTAVSKISLKSELRLSKGKTSKLTATVSPADAVVKSLQWKSSNTKVATVDAGGKVTAKSGGTATITATSKDGSKISAKCKVIVPYTITYKLNKGKNNAKNPASYYNTKITLRNPTRTGYAFKGWYTSSSYKTKISSIAKGTAKNYTLYAKWKKVTVTKGSVKSLSKPSKTKLRVTYKKISGVKGYQVQYSTSKHFTKKYTKRITTKSTVKTLSKLKSGKKYYVRVRAYKADSVGKSVYGSYSKAKAR